MTNREKANEINIIIGQLFALTQKRPSSEKSPLANHIVNNQTISGFVSTINKLMDKIEDTGNAKKTLNELEALESRVKAHVKLNHGTLKNHTGLERFSQLKNLVNNQQEATAKSVPPSWTGQSTRARANALSRSKPETVSPEPTTPVRRGG